MEQLRKKLISVQGRLIKTLGEDASALIISEIDDECGAMIHGKITNLAQAIFAVIHDNKSGVGEDLYRIIKSVTLNIIANETPYATDLVNGILNASDLTLRGIVSDKPFEKTEIIQMNPKQ